jgi:exodeoxyribonuclease-3
MKIATWNVNSLKVRLPQVLEWLQAEQPDVLALQEIKMETKNFPHEELRQAGYEAIASGQKTYNGVATLTKNPQTDTITDFPGFDDPQRRILASTIDGVRVLNLYVPNGQEVGSEKYAYKLQWFKHMQKFVKDQLKKYPKMIILGDFNVAPKDEDVYDPKRWEGRILCSDKEREAINKTLEIGFTDAFRLFEQAPNTFSWWDYRTRAFSGNRGLRIDLILTSEAISKTAKNCWVDIEPRTWERPSDHTVVVLDF